MHQHVQNDRILYLNSFWRHSLQCVMVRQLTLVQNVATRPILELCRGMERLSGSVNHQCWWGQLTDLDLLDRSGEEED